MGYGGGQELWDELTSKHGVKTLPAGTTGHQMGGFFRKPVRSLDDFRSAKYRIAGLGAAMVRAMGGSAVTLPGGEVFQALQTGLIDATEFVGPWNDQALGFARVAPHYYGPGFHEPGSIMSLDVNEQLWSNFSETERSIFETVCSDAITLTQAQYQHFNTIALKSMRENDGVILEQFPADVIQKAKEVLPEVLKNVADEGELEQRIVTSYQEHLDMYSTWSRVGEGGFYQMRS